MSSKLLPGIRRCSLFFGSAGLLAAAAVHAQNTSNEDFPELLEEVTVTAQKREQSVLDVPISMTAISATQLADLRVQGVEDFAMTVPNVTFSNFGRYDGGDVSLRGLTTFSGGLFQSTAVTVDDLGYGVTGSAGILSSRFIDIERVEVLRGPQGTLSGRNSMGGSINLVTAKPSTEATTFDAVLDYGRFSTSLAKVSGNIPLSETLAARLVAYKEDSDGAVKNAYGGNSSSIDNIGGSIALRWQPTNALTADFSFGYEDQDYGMDNTMQIDGIFEVPGDRDAAIERLALWGSDYFTTEFFNDSGVGNNGGNVYRDVIEGKSLRNELASMRISYDLGAHTLMLLGGLYENTGDNIYDFDFTEYALYRHHGFRKQRSKTFELRATSDYDGNINWVAGLSYLDERTKIGTFDEAGQWLQDGEPWVWGEEPYAIPAVGSANTGWRGVYRSDDRRNIESSSVYGNVFWNFADNWHLSAGARLTRDETGYSSDWAWDAITYDPVLSGDFVTFEGAKNELSHRIALTYDLSDSANVYAQWATGYRPGYANQRDSVLAVGAPQQVDPEHVSNYEIGTKGRLFDGRLSYALALFHMDYEDLQVETALPNPDPDNWLDDEFFFDINAGSATIQGIELELSALLTRNLEVHAGIGYNDAKIDEVVLGGVRYQDVDIPGTRSLTAMASGIYTQPITSGISARLRVDYNYQAERIDAIDATIEDFNPSFELVNISAGVFARSWSLTAYFENVLNETWWHDVNIGNYPFRGAYVNFEPRMYGVRFSYHFSGAGR